MEGKGWGNGGIYIYVTAEVLAEGYRGRVGGDHSSEVLVCRGSAGGEGGVFHGGEGAVGGVDLRLRGRGG